MTDTKPSGLVAALAQIQAEMPIVHKGMTAKIEKKSGGTFSYTYTDLADIVKVIYPLLGKVGLAFITAPRFHEGRYVLIGSLEHESGEMRQSEFPLPERGTPQELGSAITYGRRYLLGCLTGIVTGDQDDDGAAASAPRRRAQRPAETPPAPTPASVRGEIAGIGKTADLTVDKIGDDFTEWSAGQMIGEADVETLSKYRDYLHAMVNRPAQPALAGA